MELSFFALVLIVIFCFFYSWIKKVRDLGNQLLDKANEAVESWQVTADEE